MDGATGEGEGGRICGKPKVGSQGETPKPLGQLRYAFSQTGVHQLEGRMA